MLNLSPASLCSVDGPALNYAHDMIQFIDQSPSPFHAVEQSRKTLLAAGYKELSELDSWEGKLLTGRAYFVCRGGGSIIAFRLGTAALSESGARIVGAHTDSPNIRLKASVS